MFKRFMGIIMASVLMLSVLAGCGAATKNSAADSAQAPAANNYERATADGASKEVDVTFSEVVADKSSVQVTSANQNGAKNGDAGTSETPAEGRQNVSADSLTGGGSTTQNITNAILAERKIIRSASLTMEVGNFDEAMNNINTIILGIGIIQESNISTEEVYVKKDETKLIKKGTIVLRVYKEKFDSVLSNLKGVGKVFNEVISGQDVTDRFFDTESRLRLLKMEQSRLEAYLSKLEKLDDIFKTESRLTEIRQEIESLTGNLNKMSSLVELSTITISMNEKHPESEDKPKPLTYGDKLLNKLKSSLEGVVNFLGELIIIIVSALPVLILIGFFCWIGLLIYRRVPRKQYSAPTAVNKNNQGEDKKE